MGEKYYNESDVSDKADFFLDYAKESHKGKTEQFRRLEDKSVKLISLVSIMIPIFLLMLRLWGDYIFDKSNNFYFIIIFIEVIMLFSFLSAAWFFVLHSLKLGVMLTLKHDAVEVEKFIMANNQSLATTKGAIAKRILFDTAELHIQHEKKARVIGRAYSCIVFSGIFFLIFVLTILLFQFVK